MASGCSGCCFVTAAASAQLRGCQLRHANLALALALALTLALALVLILTLALALALARTSATRLPAEARHSTR
eukprot:scaffold10765_cov48-Phaeocystis_antarctica.AAC.1